ncbi:DUF4405 domain-containing protein [Neorhizobium galegae]|uniref:DUF4405 domain-containing protein n=1 Tax=Neorhizobium galegae TaxID=399 RepID=UPI0021007029|nr:DUF4405 domain-containing protein [Neorhizobium galegae]MCQ1571383.1 DUF4405 domain-containing protein [Neorhizobium galegae]
MVALAYDWLGNAMHEIVGTAMFALLIAHNTFNRRWCARAIKTRRNLRVSVDIVVIFFLAATMIVLLMTSLMISRSLFDFLPFSGGSSTRQIHGLAAYWALVIVSIHVGMRWSMIMGVTSRIPGLVDGSAVRTAILRTIGIAIAAYGIHSSFVLGLGSRLTATITVNFWDFSQTTLGFFVQIGSIIGLCACATHYTIKLLSIGTGVLGNRRPP